MSIKNNGLKMLNQSLIISGKTLLNVPEILKASVMVNTNNPQRLTNISNSVRPSQRTSSDNLNMINALNVLITFAVVSFSAAAAAFVGIVALFGGYNRMQAELVVLVTWAPRYRRGYY